MFSLIFKRLLLYPERSTPNKDQLSYFSSPVNTARCSLEVSMSSLKNKMLLWIIAVCYLIIVNTWMYYQESRLLGKKKWQIRIASVQLISKESKVTLIFSDFIRTQSKLALNERIWKEDQLTLFLRIKILKILWQKKKNACCPTPTKHPAY